MAEPIASAIGAVVFTTALVLPAFCDAPVRVANPKVAKYFGRFAFLTTHINALGAVYCAAGALLEWFGEYRGLVECALQRTFPCFFGLSTFLTIAYYATDYSNAAQVAKRRRLRSQGYRWVEVAAHAKHGGALPAAVLLAARWSGPPCSLSAAAPYLCAYAAFYSALMHVNHWLTGEWPYPAVDEAAAAGGAAGRLLLLTAPFFVAVLPLAWVGAAVTA
eukprot:TRINITY_DN1904_c0_g2_i1.p1 TRINITY_DN1904_c0_g2~~TRINITY_DN1904_c0_g2_i1.p1  ORF type:complete len:234 (+),score=75.40 TRINITY_DN1904_c0_g2_i1:48-704(+)